MLNWYREIKTNTNMMPMRYSCSRNIFLMPLSSCSGILWNGEIISYGPSNIVHWSIEGRASIVYFAGAIPLYYRRGMLFVHSMVIDAIYFNNYSRFMADAINDKEKGGAIRVCSNNICTGRKYSINYEIQHKKITYLNFSGLLLWAIFRFCW